jgi:hypothetical protein
MQTNIMDIVSVAVWLFCYGAADPSGPVPPQYGGFTITLSLTPHSVELLWMSDQLDAQIYS